MKGFGIFLIVLGLLDDSLELVTFGVILWVVSIEKKYDGPME